MTVVTNNTIQPSSGQALTIKDEGGTASITVATNGEATFAENIKITANKGINFSNYGSEDSSSATTVSGNLLSDYEEGTWAPTLSSGSATMNYARYTKIGNQVTVRLAVNDATDQTTTSQVSIQNLPFTSSSNNRAVGAVLYRYFTLGSGYTNLVGYIGQNFNTITLYKTNPSSVGYSPLEYANATRGDWDVFFSFSYMTDS